MTSTKPGTDDQSDVNDWNVGVPKRRGARSTSTAGDDLLTRDEVLGGLPTKRAATLLFLIESRAAHLAERSRHAVERFGVEERVRERELAYVEAFALGRDPPRRPTCQDMERFAPLWADLVPDNPRLRAAVAHLISQKYQFTATATPSMGQALGLTDPAVQAAYQRLYRQPLAAIYAPKQSVRERLRWAQVAASKWVEALPPFWTAFALTLSETVGAGVLALPIALAGIGPIPGIVLLVLLGLVNVITIAWIAETVTRTASVRYGGAYFQRLVTEYLGKAGSLLVTVALIVIAAGGLLGFHIGLSTTLADVTGVTPAVWMVLLFLVAGYVVAGDSLSSTVTSALGAGAANLALVLVLVGLAFAHMERDNLSRVEVPWWDGAPFEGTFLGLVFGVVLVAYFGHTSVGSSATIVLRREPSGRSLIRGVVAAQITAIAIYVVWMLAISGAVGPEALIGRVGTSLDPLADVAGPAVLVFGAVYVMLAMGMGTIHLTLALASVVRDWLPRRTPSVVLLPRGSGRFVFEPMGRTAGGAHLGLTYLGLTNDQPTFRLDAQVDGHIHQAELSGVGPWQARAAFPSLAGSALASINLDFTAIETKERQALLRVGPGVRMRYEGAWATGGFELAGILDRPEADPDWPFLQWMLRRGTVSLTEAAAWAGEGPESARARLRTFIERGLVRESSRDGESLYRARLARRQVRPLPHHLQQALDDADGAASSSSRALAWSRFSSRARQFGDLLVSDQGRRFVSLVPAALVLLVAEWLVLTDRASFTEVFNVAGVIAVPIFAGLFPCLLLVASRHKGDLSPGVLYRWLGHPALLIGVYGLFLAGILVHGLVIWEEPLQRIAALGAGALAFGITLLAIRRGAFATRSIVTLREDRQLAGATTITILSGGHPVPTAVHLRYADGEEQLHAARADVADIATLRVANIHLPPDRAHDVKVWTQRILPDGTAESLPARVQVTRGSNCQEADPRLSGGAVVLSMPGAGDGGAVEITLETT